jgi:membrane-bound lytic murein transglycosylase B
MKVRKYLDEWQRLGVRQADGSDLPTKRLKASLVLPERGGGGPAYLVYKNYRTILKWNRSNYFALAVSRLSDAIVQP